MSRQLLKKRFMKMIFSIYMFLVISIVYFPLPIAWGEYIKYKNPTIHIILWQSTIAIYKKKGLGVVIENIGGNLLLLAPMIFFLCYYLKKLNFNMKKILLISLSISLFIECSQVTMDLLCNSISGIIGYILYISYSKVIVDNIESEDSMDN